MVYLCASLGAGWAELGSSGLVPSISLHMGSVHMCLNPCSARPCSKDWRENREQSVEKSAPREPTFLEVWDIYWGE